MPSRAGGPRPLLARHSPAWVLVSGIRRRGRLVLGDGVLTYTPEGSGDLDQAWSTDLLQVRDVVLDEVPLWVGLAARTVYVSQLTVELASGEAKALYVRRTRAWVALLREASDGSSGGGRAARIVPRWSSEPLPLSRADDGDDDSAIAPLLVPVIVVVFWPLGLHLAIRGWRRSAGGMASGKVYRVAAGLGVLQVIGSVVYVLVHLHAL